MSTWLTVKTQMKRRVMQHFHICKSPYGDSGTLPLFGDIGRGIHSGSVVYRVLDSRRWGCRFKPHQCHYVLFLSKTYLSLLSAGSTQEDLS